MAHLLAFDSTYGRLGRPVEHTGDALIVAGEPIPVLSERDPAGIDWAKLGADVVIESTGKLRTRDGAALHLKGGARKVLISAPGKGVDLTVVIGVNEDAYDPARPSPASVPRSPAASGLRHVRAGRWSIRLADGKR